MISDPLFYAIAVPAVVMVGVWASRRDFDAANLKILVPAAGLGILFGWLTAAFVSESHVRLIVGLVALAFTLDHWLGARAFGTITKGHDGSLRRTNYKIARAPRFG